MKELAHRLNFFTSSFLGILGITLLSEVFQEDDFPDKIDDFLIFVLGILAIYWYRKKGYKAEKSVNSVIMLGAGVVIKLGGIIIEHADKEALGDDIGIFIAILLALILVSWQTYSKNKT